MQRRKSRASVVLLLAGVLTIGFSSYAERANASPLTDGWSRVMSIWNTLVNGPDANHGKPHHVTYYYPPPPTNGPPPCYPAPPGFPIPPGFRPCPSPKPAPPPCYPAPPGEKVPPGFRPCPFH